MLRRILLGMGAGQCGTGLLAQILDNQPNTRVTHEEPPVLPWQLEPNAPGLRERLKRMLDTRPQRFVGDVASFYLPYVEDALRFDCDVRILCLKRPRDEVVAGFRRFLDSGPFRVNHWTTRPEPDWQHDPIWTRAFPQYDLYDRDEAIRRYWEEYYAQVEQWVGLHPDAIRVWDTEILTTEAGVREVLSFAGFPAGDQVLLTGKRPAPQPPDAAPAAHDAVGPSDPRKCVILVPFSGSIHPECEESLVELERRGYPVRRVGGYAAIDQGRNQMATDALLDGFAETFWIDSDIAFHPDAVERLRSHPHPILCGIYPQKGRRALACHVMPGAPHCVFGTRGELNEILYAGTGFLLVRREVYLAMQRKLKLPLCNERFGHPMIPFFLPMIRPIEDGYWYLAEDYAFCHRARQIGYRVFADTSIRLWHIGNYRYGWEDAGQDRPRFANFTLNFGDVRSGGRDETSPTSPALWNFAQQHAWPAEKPAISGDPRVEPVTPELAELLRHSLHPSARLVLHLGAQSGQLTRFLAGLSPQATIVAVDSWRDPGTDAQAPAEPATSPGASRNLFLSECWHYRDQIVPLQAEPGEGLQQFGDSGLQPDLVCLDVSATQRSLASFLDSILDLFPATVLVGNRFDQPDVRDALERVARARCRGVEARQTAWRMFPAEQTPPSNP